MVTTSLNMMRSRDMRAPGARVALVTAGLEVRVSVRVREDAQQSMSTKRRPNRLRLLPRTYTVRPMRALGKCGWAERNQESLYNHPGDSCLFVLFCATGQAPLPSVLLKKKSGKCFQVGIFLDFGSSSTRTMHPHGACVQASGRDRLDPHRGGIELLGARTLEATSAG